MKTLLFISIYVFTAIGAYGQYAFTKQWDKRFGGYGEDMLNDIILTSDDGLLLAGWTYSLAGGDITETDRDSNSLGSGGDYWMVKLDMAGNKQWDKRFGGNDEDVLNCTIQTTDGGYMLGGGSKSGATGDKSQNSSGKNYWIIKTDATGNKQWDKTFGTINGNEELFSITETNNKQYILGGISYGGIGGDKTDTSRGGMDFWVIKIDSAGNKIWDKTYGGSKDDYLKVIIASGDSGYILAGGSMSGIGGDKTQSNWDTTNTSFDFWIIKIDTLGNQLWNKRYGGSKGEYVHDIKLTKDNGFIMGGTSSSPAGGDKTQNNWGSLNQAADYWIMKTDSNGHKQWDKRYGGDSHDLLQSVSITSDGGYFLCGYSWSDVTGNKSENNMGAVQSWVVKTNSTGDLVWDKTMFMPSVLTGPYANKGALRSEDGCYIVANTNHSDSGGYKSQPNWGSPVNATNWWVIKFCMDNTTGITESENESFFVPYPNPVTNTLTIQTTATVKTTLQILNLQGQQLTVPLQVTGNRYEQDVSFLPAGIYMAVLQNNEQRVVRRFVKE